MLNFAGGVGERIKSRQGFLIILLLVSLCVGVESRVYVSLFLCWIVYVFQRERERGVLSNHFVFISSYSYSYLSSGKRVVICFCS